MTNPTFKNLEREIEELKNEVADLRKEIKKNVSIEDNKENINTKANESNNNLIELNTVLNMEKDNNQNKVDIEILEEFKNTKYRINTNIPDSAKYIGMRTQDLSQIEVDKMALNFNNNLGINKAI